MSKARRTYPPLGGGQDLDLMLKGIEDELKALNASAAKGEDVTDQLKKLNEDVVAIKASIDKDVKESRKDAPSKEQEDIAASIEAAVQKAFATQVVVDDKKVDAPVADDKKDAPETSQKAISDAVSAGVQEALKSIREPSRFKGEGASEEAIETVVAQAKSLGLTIRDPSGVRLGADREVKAFFESKGPDGKPQAQFAKFFGMVYRQAKGVATEFDRKALAESTDSAGGYLVPQQWMDDILGLIRAQAVVRQAGPRIVPFSKQMNQTSIASGATAFYALENAQITKSEPTFAEAPLLTPKNLTGLVPVSNYLLEDAGEAESIVRADLAEVIALREDLAFIEGTGASGQPRGLKNISGITDMTAANVGGSGALGVIAANGDRLNADMIRRLIAQLRILNVRGARLAFFFHPALLTQLELQKDTQGRYFLESGVLQLNDDQATGSIWGVPFYTTTQIPVNVTRGTSSTATYLLLVNMAETVVGINKELTIDASSETTYWDGSAWVSAFQNTQTVFRAVMRHDIAHRRPNQILLVNGIESV